MAVPTLAMLKPVLVPAEQLAPAVRGQHARSLPALALPWLCSLSIEAFVSPLCYRRDLCLSCIGCPKGSSSSELQFVILGGSELFHPSNVILEYSLCDCLIRHLAVSAGLFSYLLIYNII